MAPGGDPGGPPGGPPEGYKYTEMARERLRRSGSTYAQRLGIVHPKMTGSGMCIRRRKPMTGGMFFIIISFFFTKEK